jgi:hypothetical protein
MDRIIQGHKFDTQLNSIVSIKRRRKRSILLLPDSPARPILKDRHHQLYLPLDMPSSLKPGIARSALSALKIGGRTASSSSARSFVSNSAWGGSHGTQTRRPHAVSRTPFFSSAVPGSDLDSSSAPQGSATSDHADTDQVDLGPSELGLGPMESVYSMPIGSQEIGPQASFATTLYGDRSSKATTSSIPEVHGSNLDPKVSPLPGCDELPPSFTDDSLKPPQPSIVISSVGPDGSRETHLFKLGGVPVFAELFKMCPRKSQSSMYVK